MRAEIYYKILIKCHKLAHKLYNDERAKANLEVVYDVVYKEQNKLPYIFGSYVYSDSQIKHFYEKLAWGVFVKDMVNFFKENGKNVSPKDIKNAMLSKNVRHLLMNNSGFEWSKKVLDYFYK